MISEGTWPRTDTEDGSGLKIYDYSVFVVSALKFCIIYALPSHPLSIHRIVLWRMLTLPVDVLCLRVNIALINK